MASKVSIGLVGCGFGGVKLLRNLLHLGAEVIVVDPVEAHRRMKALNSEPRRSISALSELPKGSRALSSAHLSRIARRPIEDALGHNVPVLTERPFTTDVDAAARLASQAPDRLFIMHTMRHHVGVGVLSSIVAEKELGIVEWLRVTRTSWSNRHNDPDLAWSLLSQDLSIVLEILGEDTTPAPRLP